MRYLAAALALALAACGSEDEPAPQAAPWAKSYGGTGLETAGPVARGSDGGYVAGGANAGRAWLFRTDASGEILWERTYGGPGDATIRALLALPGGGGVAVGELGSDAWVMKFLADGTPEWQFSIGGAGTDGALAVEADGAEFLVAGYTSSFGAGGFDAWLLRVSSAGGILSQRTVGTAGHDLAYAIARTAGGGYLVGGTTGRRAWLVKFDASETVDWQRAYAGDHFGGLDVTPEGDFIAAGEVLARVGPSGDVAWQKSFGDAVWRGVAWPVVAGTTDLGVTLLRMGPDGSPEWQRLFVQAEGAFGMQLAPAYVVAASIGGNALLMRVDGEGRTGLTAWDLTPEAVEITAAPVDTSAAVAVTSAAPVAGTIETGTPSSVVKSLSP